MDSRFGDIRASFAWPGYRCEWGRHRRLVQDSYDASVPLARPSFAYRSENIGSRYIFAGAGAPQRRRPGAQSILDRISPVDVGFAIGFVAPLLETYAHFEDARSVDLAR